eukprot:CAMPEP_0174712256 /NCGR_PEP_ID=MMETSP1094-20130205/13320_1 /TAXON_ID=156173 /ORGANISM="Chrysochromulina brevifilum, Strain UTEX LB 985" /LENGTH=140 /DNA_ID=CAMNT_0015911313 /DNA_START=452 /DNA_END=875 /DNA_ORIENTATION=-
MTVMMLEAQLEAQLEASKQHLGPCIGGPSVGLFSSVLSLRVNIQDDVIDLAINNHLSCRLTLHLASPLTSRTLTMHPSTQMISMGIRMIWGGVSWGEEIWGGVSWGGEIWGCPASQGERGMGGWQVGGGGEGGNKDGGDI